MKKLYLFLIFLLSALPVMGQSTTVSGTISDTSGQAWLNGTYSFVFKVSPSQPTGVYHWNGGNFSTTQTIAGNLDGSGHFSVSVPSNTSITPSGSTWVLTVCPVANGNIQCYTTPGLTITGATQSLTSVVIPPAISIDLAHPAYPFTLAYKHAEITTAPLGGIYYDTVLGHYYICEALSLYACTNWVQICQTGDSCGGAGTNITIQHNGTVVGSEPIVNFIDGANVTLTVANNVGLTRIDTTIAASGGGGSGCTLPNINTAVLSEHPAGTCYDSLHWTWDDGTNEQNMQAGLSNTITNQQLSFLNGNNLTATSDVSGAMQDIFMSGDYMSVTATQGALSAINDAVMIGGGAVANGQQINATNGGAIFEVACFLRACEHQGAFHGIQATGSGGSQDTNINVIFSAGRFNDITAASLSNTSSIFALSESSHFTSANGCNNSDNFTLGEFVTVACSTASTADVDDTVILGQNHSVSSTTHNLGYSYILGNNDTITQSSGSNIANIGLFGKSLTATNVSDCWLVGENGHCTGSNLVGIGLSSTPEIVVTPGAVSITGTTTVNGSPIVSGPAIQASSITLPSGDVSVTATVVTTVATKSVTMPSAGCPCRADVKWEAGATTSNSGGVEYWVNDGTNNFATGGANTTGSVGPPTQFHASGGSYSPGTYANSATITFTWKVESEQNIVVRQASQFSPQGSYLNVAILTSN